MIRVAKAVSDRGAENGNLIKAVLQLAKERMTGDRWIRPVATTKEDRHSPSALVSTEIRRCKPQSGSESEIESGKRLKLPSKRREPPEDTRRDNSLSAEQQTHRVIDSRAFGSASTCRAVDVSLGARSRASSGTSSQKGL
jgi:hypothetical protein